MPQIVNIDLTDKLPIHEKDTHFDFVHRVDEQVGLRCLYTNTDRLQNKLTELETFCIENKIDLIAITETLPKEKYS